MTDTPSQFNISLILGIAGLAVGVIAANVAITSYLIKQSEADAAPTLVTVNAADMLLGLVASQPADTTSEELVALSKRFNGELDGILERFAAERNLMIVNSAAVISGALDVTPAVLRSISLTPKETGL